VSQLYDVVHGILARGPRTTEEIIAECRRPGLPYRPETIQLFLRLSREIEQRNGTWSLRGGSKQQRLLVALQKVFASGATYVPLDRLAQFVDEQDAVTQEDIAVACDTSGLYRLQGRFILRT
jgi:hypothetical protein